MSSSLIASSCESYSLTTNELIQANGWRVNMINIVHDFGFKQWYGRGTTTSSQDPANSFKMLFFDGALADSNANIDHTAAAVVSKSPGTNIRESIFAIEPNISACGKLQDILGAANVSNSTVYDALREEGKFATIDFHSIFIENCDTNVVRIILSSAIRLARSKKKLVIGYILNERDATCQYSLVARIDMLSRFILEESAAKGFHRAVRVEDEEYARYVTLASDGSAARFWTLYP